MGGREDPGEVRREVGRLEEERRRLDPEARDAEETRELEAAGWEQRGGGRTAIWRRPEDGRWYAHYQALGMLRKEGARAAEGLAMPGGAA